jgi:hypothetical protein
MLSNLEIVCAPHSRVWNRENNTFILSKIFNDDTALSTKSRSHLMQLGMLTHLFQVVIFPNKRDKMFYDKKLCARVSTSAVSNCYTENMFHVFIRVSVLFPFFNIKNKRISKHEKKIVNYKCNLLLLNWFKAWFNFLFYLLLFLKSYHTLSQKPEHKSRT